MEIFSYLRLENIADTIVCKSLLSIISKKSKNFRRMVEHQYFMTDYLKKTLFRYEIVKIASAFRNPTITAI